MHIKFSQACVVARNNTGLTQEQAEVALNISRRSLSDYERGTTRPADDVVKRMMEKYNADWLGYIWLQDNQVGDSILPHLELRSLSSSVLCLQKEMDDLEIANHEMVDVARDDKVSANEKGKWNKSLQHVREMFAACLTVMFAPIKEKSG